MTTDASAPLRLGAHVADWDYAAKTARAAIATLESLRDCPTERDIGASLEEPQYDYDLHCSRSQPRLKTGEIAFECQYGSDSPVKVGLSAFFDAEGWCTDFEVCSAINDWCAKAKDYPNARRKCLMCKCKATKGFVVCGKCDKVWGSVIYTDED